MEFVVVANVSCGICRRSTLAGFTGFLMGLFSSPNIPGSSAPTGMCMSSWQLAEFLQSRLDKSTGWEGDREGDLCGKPVLCLKEK